MQNRLQELTKKIYNEGVSKGNEEAQNIINNAKKEAEGIISKANKEAKSIIDAAKKKSEEIKKNTESELKLSSKQAFNSLKQKVTDIISDKILEESVSDSFNKTEFIQEIILTISKNWNPKSSDSFDIKILLPAKDEKKLKDFFTKSAKELLNKGMEIEFDANVKSGFQISPKDGSYKISFADKDFINFFKDYLRPVLTDLLFANE